MTAENRPLRRIGSPRGRPFCSTCPRLSPECEYSDERVLSVVHQGVRVVAESFGSLAAGQGDLCSEDGGGFVSPAMDEHLAQLVAQLLYLCSLATLQI